MRAALMTIIASAAALAAGLAGGASAGAVTKTPSPAKAMRVALTGTALTVTWKATSGTVEAKIKTTVGAKTRTTTKRAKASKGSLTTKVVGAKGAALARTAVRVRTRRCVGAGRAKRCSGYGKWKRPSAAKLPGGETPGTGTTPGPGSTPGTAPTTPAGASGPVPMIGGCPVFPADHAFNQDVSGFPLDPRSDAYIQTIGASGRVHPDFGAADLGQGPGGFGIPYRVVPMSQPLVATVFDPQLYKDESDPGDYPIPLDTPVEGGPNSTGDRHVLVVRQEECRLYELGNAYPRSDHWDASGGAIWKLADGKRTVGDQPEWTSADAAGLAILPALVRYDEVAAGEIRHAVRFTVSGTQRAYIAPASHWTNNVTDPNVPPMGLRLRMRANFDLSKFKGQSLVIATALKKYGMIVADNGSDWYISGAADSRWDDEDLNQLKSIPGNAFEVVKTGEIVRGY